MNTIKIKPTDEASQGPFVVISRADFNPEIHEALDPADLASADEQPRALTTKDLDDARRELEGKHDDLLRMKAELDAERERLGALVAEQEAERSRLTELTTKLAEQGEAKPPGIAVLRDELTTRGIAFDPAAKKADLQALLDAADKK